MRVPQTQGGDLIAHQYETGNQMNPKGLRLVAFMMVRGKSLAEDEDNAKLIAAAPDLLEACFQARRINAIAAAEGYLHPEKWGDELFAAQATLSAAIAKATQ
jgi:hypothetical protein